LLKCRSRSTPRIEFTSISCHKTGPQDQEIARLESLGARIVDDRRGVHPGGWVVMADVEGNDFCVEGGE
jgi:hypothetical protein